VLRFLYLVHILSKLLQDTASLVGVYMSGSFEVRVAFYEENWRQSVVSLARPCSWLC